MLAAFREAGVTGQVHAVDVLGGRDLGVGADEDAVLASVFKVPLLVAFARLADAGALDPRERVHVPAEGRSPGPTGISAMLDPVDMSLRDLAFLMITVSDNTAADTLVGRVGLDAVNAAMRELGLRRTHVEHTGQDMYALMTEDVGGLDPAEFFADPAAIARMRVLDPAVTNRGTPREMTRLLELVWRDEAASPESCAMIRRCMGLQVWPHRLASGFPYDDVMVSGKTGTLPTIRNEIGVVEYPDGGTYAVAVFTRSSSTAQTQPRADAVIGVAARLAVEALRRS
ncbi:serine hydrolase [Bailinhaonella thermotolerans]|uniref:Serine hydrolase n=1 Tax=Bailinhaonella thermotolerans TaxID=1070861 RepID=A0A3A4B918_9ACTN|nr:serine hydrolase [Bailinhaonella thermotolerans]